MGMRKAPDKPARVAALWMLHGKACVKLLRAHGSNDHAGNMDAALSQMRDILAAELGADALAEALDWATEQLWTPPTVETAPGSVH